jgi:DNA invertase Pin-like site-specific DNA recombinase
VSVAEFVEVESGRSHENRPRLSDALAECRRRKATLIVARLDRLTRDAHFLLGLQKAGVKFVAGDFPEANELTIGILAMVAQYES